MYHACEMNPGYIWWYQQLASENWDQYQSKILDRDQVLLDKKNYSKI